MHNLLTLPPYPTSLGVMEILPRAVLSCTLNFGIENNHFSNKLIVYYIAFNKF